MSLKAKVRNLSLGDSNKAIMYIRLFLMERFLKRLSLSQYKNNFIIKGGILVSSLIGIERRGTIDIDTTIESLSIKEDDVRCYINS
jgi:hypothetical protein